MRTKERTPILKDNDIIAFEDAATRVEEVRKEKK